MKPSSVFGSQASAISVIIAKRHFDRLAFAFLLFRAGVATIAYFLLVLWLQPDYGFRGHIVFVQWTLFAVVGGWAYRSGKDEASRLLGVFLMCTSGAYSIGAVMAFGNAVPNLKFLTEVIVRTRFEIFFSWYAWRFLEYFPKSYEPPRLATVRRAFTFAAFLLALFYFILGLIDFSLTLMRVEITDFARGVWYLADSAWYSSMFLAFLSIVLLFVKLRGSRGDERRRSTLLAYAFLLGFGPMTVQLTVEWMFPPILYLSSKDAFSQDLRFIVSNVLLATMPFLSFHAVTSSRVLDIPQLARSAIRYLLAKFSATAIGLTPFVVLIAFLIRNRDQTLEQLFSGLTAILLVGLTGLGIALLRFRRVIMTAVDRRFFRDQYNARVVLVQLAEQVRGTRNRTELSNLVGQGIDLALHLERVYLLTLNESLGRYVDPLEKTRPLDTATTLTTILQGSREPLVIDFEDPRSAVKDLPDDEKHWLIDGKVDMLSPCYSLDGSLIGILVLGRKKSDESFNAEDKDLVKGVCSSAGLVIELLQLKERPTFTDARSVSTPASEVGPFDQPLEEEKVAKECPSCSRVVPSSDDRCPTCDSVLEPAVVPYVLRGQYRFESRLGAGGMAVVYRATDLRLGREVAIKTLPRVSPEAAMRLHREARTAATVTDPGLAAIYGIETWEGMPLLIQEYLQSGTLSDQLMAGEPLDPLLAIDMGKTVALALQKIHSVGILHRDLKPSNIGYTLDGHAKLLDFGVARIHHDMRQEADIGFDEPLDHRSRVLNTASWVIGRTATGQLVGTIGYLSPEAVMGHRPEPSMDLWALSVVLWESLAGVNLFTGQSFQKVLEKIRDVKVADLREYLPDCPEPVEAFFARELHPNKMKRARSGREMYERLEALRLELVG